MELISRHCPFKSISVLQSLLPMKLHHLKEIEKHATAAISSCHHPSLNDVVFIGGSTPLIIACQFGQLDSVKHLIDIWKVSVNASATYFSDPALLNYSEIRIDEASPLFVAAFHGHSRVVRYLLEKGAEPSVKLSIRKGNHRYFHQFYGWTPLHAALSGKLISSQRPLLEQQEERNVIARTLLEFGADPNAGGQTLLHHIISRFTDDDSLMALVILLVENGADLTARDEEGFTPLLTAADTFKLKIFDYLLERDAYNRTEVMEAMELAGSTILLGAPPSLFPKAFDYWRRAHQLRQLKKESYGSSAEKKLGRKIGSNVEWTTLAELDQLKQRSKEYTIQAVLVKLRILSRFNGNGHHSLSSWYISRILALSSSWDQESLIGEYSQIVDIRWGMLDVTISRLNPFSTNQDVLFNISHDVKDLVESLSKLEGLHSTPGLTLSNYYQMLKTSMDLILLATGLSALDCKLDITKYSYFHSIYPLLEMIFRLPELPDERNTSISLGQMLRQLELFLGPNGLGKLLFFPHNSFYQSNQFKLINLALIRVLLEAGADPNMTDKMHHGDNTLLHFVAAMSDRKLGDAAGRLLVGYGAKMNLPNRTGKTALDIWIEMNETEENWNEELGGWSARPEWCCPLPTLLNLAARVIRVRKLPYLDAPVILHSVVELRD